MKSSNLFSVKSVPALAMILLLFQLNALAGPPLLGFVGDQVGTLDALLVVAFLLVPSALLVPAARKPEPASVRAH